MPNRIAYLGDRFEVKIDAGAYNCQGGSVLKVSKIGKGGKVLKSENITIAEGYFEASFSAIIEAEEAGVQTLPRLPSQGCRMRSVYANNVKDFFIEVLDSRKKILIFSPLSPPGRGRR